MMKKFTERYSDELVSAIKAGDIGVLLTDTIYGLVASANDGRAVERVYEARGRDRMKPCIVLIDSVSQIWDSALPLQHEEIIHQYWPGKVSIVLPIEQKTPEYIHRNFNGTVVFRMPDDQELRKLLRETGPIIAPSANPEGMTPASDIAQAESYFGDMIDFYVDSGVCENTTPSRIIKLEQDSSVTILR